MKQLSRISLLVPLAALLSLGCKESSPAKPQAQATQPQPTNAGGDSSNEEKEIAATLAKLSPEDRKLAEAQKFCPISDDRLGSPSMGVPIKLMVQGEPVFICCKGCTKVAEKDPDKTLAKLKELKAKNQPAK